MSDLPEEMWFGNIAGEWPIQCWESQTHAMAWVNDSGPDQRRRIWKAKVVDPVEYVAITPKPYLQERELTEEGGGA